MAKKEETALVAKEEAGLPAVIDFGADVGGGFEEADKDSYAIPFLKVLQSGSPQCKRSDGAYIKGAEEGMLFNTVTEEVIDTTDAPLVLVPCYYRHVYLKWAPGRGGFRGSMTPAEYATARTRRVTITGPDGSPKEVEVDQDDNVIDDFREHYCLRVKPNGSYEPLLLSLGSSQIKKSKRWMTLMQNIKLKNGQVAPMFSQLYNLTTVAESNDQGSWFGVKVEHKTQITSAELYEAAKAFREMIRSGAAQPQEYTNGTEPQPGAEFDPDKF